MKIIYFHGYASSGASGTVELLRKALPDDEVLSYLPYPYRPAPEEDEGPTE